MRKAIFIQISRTLLVAALASLSGASVVQAQGNLWDSCFRGHPLPACKVFWIGEVGYGYLPNQGPGNPSHQVNLDLGGMANLNEWAAPPTSGARGGEIASGSASRRGIGTGYPTT